MKKILVPTDFSPNATRAIDYAVQIAKLNKGTIWLVNSCEHLDTFSLEAGLPKAEYNKVMADKAYAELELIQKSIMDTELVEVKIQLYSGPIVDTIVVAAEELQAELVIMGNLGITGLRERIFGTNTAAVISNSKIPVLAIPLEYDWSMPRKFLLAINNFNEVSDIVHPVFDLAGVFRAEVKVVVFTDEDNAEATDFLQDEKGIQEAEEKLKIKYPNLIISAEHLSGRDFENSINNYIAENKIDLLAMTTHKRSFIGNLFNRSITRKMSYHAKVPLLSIPVNK
ncbi:MAG: universal stress protein [Chitinophagaceae bacterium]|nr:universal stress protein [Chitinophagaceae bacterium]